jgi:ApaG protein
VNRPESGKVGESGAYFTPVRSRPPRRRARNGPLAAAQPLPHNAQHLAAARGLPTILTRRTMSEYAFSVAVRTQYMADQSDPDRGRYAFAYTITIHNTGEVAAQLISRHWIITDSDNTTQEVSGLGVVGHQPLLKPGEHFEYSSWATISTPVGSMKGEYFCVAEDGHRFEAPIPEFALVLPRMLH